LPCQCGSANTATASYPYCCASYWGGYGYVTNSKTTCDAHCGTAIFKIKNLKNQLASIFQAIIDLMNKIKEMIKIK